MADHLIALAVGPVQEFIAAARRTRDLWFGSRMLSELCKAAARAIQSEGGRLVFPAPEALAADTGVANVILARLPAPLAPSGAAKQARDAVISKWQVYATKTKHIAGQIISPNVWEDQIGDVVEFYAAAVPLESDGHYAAARSRLMRLLAGRKACRDFEPARGRRLPKSSLDGRRETVLRGSYVGQRADSFGRLGKLLRLNPGEQLDAVGLVKRLAGGEGGTYPSVSRIAADPWVRGISRKSSDSIMELRRICGGLDLTRVDAKLFPEFPFEGTALYRTRLHELALDTGNLNGLLERLYRVHGEPDPYFAILAADGDGMGAAISSIGDEARHRALSEKLAEFASKAREIVESHGGVLVYSGGDDVLAFAPVDKCIACARSLHDCFGELMKRAGAPGPPTLSAGIAVGHFMEPLQDLLGYARDAEKAAKRPDRNGLAVHVHTRGGSPLFVRAQWSTGIDRQLLSLAEMHAFNRIPDKSAYDLRELARLYTTWPRSSEAERAALDEAIRKDVELLLRRKRITDPDVIHSILQAAGPEGSWTDAGVRLAAERIIVARRLQASLRQSDQPVPQAAETNA